MIRHLRPEGHSGPYLVHTGGGPSYDQAMEDSQVTPGPEADASDDRGLGRFLDAAGIIAGIALVVMVIDVLTDGRLISRRLFGDGDADAAA